MRAGLGAPVRNVIPYGRRGGLWVTGARAARAPGPPDEPPDSSKWKWETDSRQYIAPKVVDVRFQAPGVASFWGGMGLRPGFCLFVKPVEITMSSSSENHGNLINWLARTLFGGFF